MAVSLPIPLQAPTSSWGVKECETRLSPKLIPSELRRALVSPPSLTPLQEAGSPCLGLHHHSSCSSLLLKIAAPPGRHSGPRGDCTPAQHCTALHCIALHCTPALHCPALHPCTSLSCPALLCTALHWPALHPYTALSCTALHRTAWHCIALHCTPAAQRAALPAHRWCWLLYLPVNRWS